MKRISIPLVAVLLVVTAGCGAVRDDLRHPGGYPGRILDKRTFDASQSKHVQLWRAALMVAIAARIGESVVTAEDADAFARQLSEASREINLAAADAGFPVTDDKGVVHKTCTIGTGLYGTYTSAWDMARTPHDDQKCAGYYVNFESHMARIEERVIRAMLTSLPTEKARKFLGDISKGDALSAMWSLARSLGDVAVAFHRGAGVYRSGTESMAASLKQCGTDDRSYRGSAPRTFDERTATVFAAARCMGLSRHDLFDGEAMEGDEFPVRMQPAAFHAMFRIARTACLRLPSVSTGDQEYLAKSREMRTGACSAVSFRPQMEPELFARPEPVAVPQVAAPPAPPVPAPPLPVAPSIPAIGPAPAERLVPPVPAAPNS